MVVWLDAGFAIFVPPKSSFRDRSKTPGPSELQQQLRTHGGPGEQRPAAQLPHQGRRAGELRGQGLGAKSRAMAGNGEGTGLLGSNARKGGES